MHCKYSICAVYIFVKLEIILAKERLRPKPCAGHPPGTGPTGHHNFTRDPARYYGEPAQSPHSSKFKPDPKVPSLLSISCASAFFESLPLHSTIFAYICTHVHFGNEVGHVKQTLLGMVRTHIGRSLSVSVMGCRMHCWHGTEKATKCEPDVASVEIAPDP